MRLYLLDGQGNRRKAHEPYAGADHAVVDGACPVCAATPFKAQGTGRRVSADDRAYEADAVSVCCSQHVGTLRLETGTLFGVREDEAISRMGVKIY